MYVCMTYDVCMYDVCYVFNMHLYNFITVAYSNTSSCSGVTTVGSVVYVHVL